MPSNQIAQIKSVHADWPAYVTFVNRTNVPVDIAWVDYRGKLVRYRNELGPGNSHHQNTYVSHPWVAWSSHSQDKLLVGGGFVFEPQPYRGEQTRTLVFIDRPVLSLLKLCIKKIRLLVGPDQVEDLEIPKDLFRILKKRHNVEFQDVTRQNRQ
ncbi:unnamed protein product [Candidula unifasciata]|uniref:von Hippel-Lindau disease tumour suppressor beta domain-containing protein n=1 Tax=Candidula unifasciata TaxID=100452 RepID=A0A8S3YDS8_9EUPU|nr:unnamed protein product [Candidula unifasciata]